MRARDFAKLIGYEVVNEFGELLGVIVGFTSNGLGKVNSVLIRSAGEVYEVNFERLEKTEENKFKLLSNLFYKYKKIANEIEYVYTRIENITKISEENINKNILSIIKNKTENAFKELQAEISSLKSEVQSRIDSLYNVESKLDEAIIELKLAYLSDGIDKNSFDSKLEHILNTKDRISKELTLLKGLLESIETLNKERTVELRVVS